MKQKIHTEKAPKAIGPYSQAIVARNTVYCSGQIPLDPVTMTLVADDFAAQVSQTFANIQAVCEAAGGNIASIVKLTIYLTDLNNFGILNEMMMSFFSEPYPARTTIEVSALPKGADVEIEAIMVI